MITLLAILALGGAGIVALASHPPGTAARAELTWAGDQALRPELDEALADLEAIASDVDRLGVLARGAIGAMTADDPEPFNAAIIEGTQVAREIETSSAALRATLNAMPGVAATDTFRYGAEVLARRVAMLAALEATENLRVSWARLTAGGLQAATLIGLLTEHDHVVAAAAAQGRASEYDAALQTLGRAVAMLDEAEDIRDQLANTSDVQILDEWLSRNRRYDEALEGLYSALRDSGGIVNDAVREAYREESEARAVLPPDTRGLTIIVADAGRGGLNQAVIAIEQARGRLNLALEALEPEAGA